MTTYSVDGLGVYTDYFTGEILEINNTDVTLDFVAPDQMTTTSFHYANVSQFGTPTGAEYAIFDFYGYNFVIGGEENLNAQNADFSLFVDILWFYQGLDSADVSLFFFQGYQIEGLGLVNIEYLFSIDGDPLPDISTASELENFTDGFISVTPVDGNIVPYEEFDLADIADTITENDVIVGTFLDDTINGGKGNDDIDGGSGDDTLSGGVGNDLFRAGFGADTMNGGAGQDTMDYTNAFSGLVVDMEDSSQNAGDALGDTLNSIENLFGGDFNDDLRATDEANLLKGGDGDDLLNGRGGADALDGGLGIDSAVYDDAVAGVIADLANVKRNAGEALGDTYTSIENIIGSDHGDDLRGNSGANVILSGIGDDVLQGRGGDDTLNGDNGDDILLGGVGADVLNGGKGTDIASYAKAKADVLVDLVTASLNAGEAEGDTFSSIEGIYGGNYDDDLSGSAKANTILGGKGSDTIDGRAGDDILEGGAHVDSITGGIGDDAIRGGGGNDLMSGDQGADSLNGGKGVDTVTYASAASGVVADFVKSANNTGHAAGDTYVQVENLVGSAFSDTLAGNGADNRIQGGRGNDTLIGRGGDDTMLGGSGKDTFNGGAGNDTMTGNKGVDTFIFNGGADVITDFNGDRLELTNALWGDPALTKAEVLAFASVVGSDTVFDFGGGNTLTLEDYTDIAGLETLMSLY